MRTQIDILPSSQVDKSKWDNCVLNSKNALIYARSFYLDHLADEWHGIVVNDYDVVMPVPWRKKFGIKYCYDTPFIQQLGWFQQREINNTSLLLKALFSFCNYGDYSFNFENLHELNDGKASTNYIIDLSRQYADISKGYSEGFRYSLKKALVNQAVYTEGTFTEIIALHRHLYSHRVKHVSVTDYENLENLCRHMSQNANIVVRKISGSANELLSGVLLLKDEKRLYNIINCTTEAGRKYEANYLLFDSIFKEFANSKMIFDFEGSDIPGVNLFYKKFGAINQPYCTMHFNHLPFPLRLLKQ